MTGMRAALLDLLLISSPSFQLTATACRKEIWIPEVAQAYTSQNNGGGVRGKSGGGALDERKEAAALSMQRRLVHTGTSSDNGAEVTDGGRLQWHQALSSCPGLPLLVIGTKSELADAASRAGGVSQDAKLLSPLS